MSELSQNGATITARELLTVPPVDHSAELRLLLAEAQRDLATLSVQRKALALSKKATVDALAVTSRIQREYDALILRLEVALGSAE